MNGILVIDKPAGPPPSRSSSGSVRCSRGEEGRPTPGTLDTDGDPGLSSRCAWARRPRWRGCSPRATRPTTRWLPAGRGDGHPGHLRQGAWPEKPVPRLDRGALRRRWSASAGTFTQVPPHHVPAVKVSGKAALTRGTRAPARRSRREGREGDRPRAAAAGLLPATELTLFGALLQGLLRAHRCGARPGAEMGSAARCLKALRRTASAVRCSRARCPLDKLDPRQAAALVVPMAEAGWRSAPRPHGSPRRTMAAVGHGVPLEVPAGRGGPGAACWGPRGAPAAPGRRSARTGGCGT